MAFRGGLMLLFPLAVMVVFIMLSVSSASSLGGSGPASFCKAGQNCNINSTASTVTYYCPYNAPNLNGGLACQIFPTCSNPNSPAWCYPFPISLLYGGTYLWQGESVVYTQAQAQAASGSAYFGFNSNTSLAFVGFIFVLIGVAVLAGLNILGTGLQGESIQMMIQGAIWVGLWMVLTGLEGFPSPNGTDVFGQLNYFYGFGGALYAILTLVYLIGFAGTISRSGV